MNHKKYEAIKGPKLENRSWPDRQITKAPIWCSVDLRDGNQALDIPMSLEQKVAYFKHLVDLGFKQIEIGFPSSSDTEFAFARYLIVNNLIPDDVSIQVLTPARDFIIRHTFESIIGAKQAIIHLYVPTSIIQRELVLGMNREDVIEMAVKSAELMLELSNEEAYKDIDISFEFSPEGFMGTECDFAVEICDAVCDVWQPTDDHQAIINLPNTVELTTANIFADQVEYFATNTRWRNQIQLSVHTHNDRGGAVAAAELALQAGADRVEGTLFGNGERTGNCDIVTMALNLLTAGVDPELDFSDIEQSRSIYETLTNMIIPPRQPYAGDLVYTAFSGSHQDAIRKGMANKKSDSIWRVPYLPLDPEDLGRSYDPIIRINSQSGRSGISYIFEQNFGIILPKFAQAKVAEAVKEESVKRSKELISSDLLILFREYFVNQDSPFKLFHFIEEMVDEKRSNLEIELSILDHRRLLHGSGSGVVDAFCNILSTYLGCSVEVSAYQQQALERGSSSRAMSYIELTCGDQIYIGAGESSSSTKSSLRAVVSAVNRMIRANHDMEDKIIREITNAS